MVLSGVITTLAFSAVVDRAYLERPQRLRGDEGAIVFSYTQPDFGRWNPLPSFQFVEFDPEAGDFVDNGADVSHAVQVKDWPLTRKRMDPGTYVLRDIFLYAGSSSGYCFGSETIQFEVRPGEVTYLGHLTFEAASGSPGGLANNVLGNNGDWHGRVINSQGDRDSAEADLGELFRDVSEFNDQTPQTTTFDFVNRSRREVGRVCSNAEEIQ